MKNFKKVVLSLVIFLSITCTASADYWFIVEKPTLATMVYCNDGGCFDKNNKALSIQPIYLKEFGQVNVYNGLGRKFYKEQIYVMDLKNVHHGYIIQQENGVLTVFIVILDKHK